MLVAPTLYAQSSSEIEEVTVFSQKQPYRGDVPLESLPQQVQVISADIIDQLDHTEF